MTEDGAWTVERGEALAAARGIVAAWLQVDPAAVEVVIAADE